MKDSHWKGPASHPDPESCVDGRKAGDEALTGAHTGQPLSCEWFGMSYPSRASNTNYTWFKSCKKILLSS
jgi:hypothetical protein